MIFIQTNELDPD